MKYQKVRGIVLRDNNFEESSKILTILTDALGKIKVISKNCRRTLNPLGAVSQPLIYSEFVLQKTNDVYTISSASVVESFFEITEDVGLTIYSSYLIELVDSFIQNEQKSEDILRLLLNSLYLLKNRFNPETVCRIFEIKILVFSGFFPQFTHCIKCKRSDLTKVYFSFENCGILCDNCKEVEDEEISLDLIKDILTIAAMDLKKLNKVDIDDKININMSKIMRKYIKFILQRDINSLDFFRFIQ